MYFAYIAKPNAVVVIDIEIRLFYSNKLSGLSIINRAVKGNQEKHKY